jgi:hypothetical protein
MIPDYSIIITHRTSTFDRERNLQYVLNLLNDVNNAIDENIEVILVEQDVEPKIKIKFPKIVKYVFN